uniref:BAH domain-containing protein n=1 Tax=Macrostomum lignano TaxID=282301 RepID=A0A1I8FE05_9PLAT
KRQQTTVTVTEQAHVHHRALTTPLAEFAWRRVPGILRVGNAFLNQWGLHQLSGWTRSPSSPRSCPPSASNSAPYRNSPACLPPLETRAAGSGASEKSERRRSSRLPSDSSKDAASDIQRSPRRARESCRTKPPAASRKTGLEPSGRARGVPHPGGVRAGNFLKLRSRIRFLEGAEEALGPLIHQRIPSASRQPHHVHRGLPAHAATVDSQPGLPAPATKRLLSGRVRPEIGTRFPAACSKAHQQSVRRDVRRKTKRPAGGVPADSQRDPTKSPKRQRIPPRVPKFIQRIPPESPKSKRSPQKSPKAAQYPAKIPKEAAGSAKSPQRGSGFPPKSPKGPANTAKRVPKRQRIRAQESQGGSRSRQESQGLAAADPAKSPKGVAEWTGSAEHLESHAARLLLDGSARSSTRRSTGCHVVPLARLSENAAADGPGVKPDPLYILQYKKEKLEESREATEEPPEAGCDSEAEYEELAAAQVPPGRAGQHRSAAHPDKDFITCLAVHSKFICVYAVAISPNFAATQSYVTGDDRLILVRPGFIKKQHRVLAEARPNCGANSLHCVGQQPGGVGHRGGRPGLLPGGAAQPHLSARPATETDRTAAFI